MTKCLFCEREIKKKSHACIINDMPHIICPLCHDFFCMVKREYGFLKKTDKLLFIMAIAFYDQHCSFCRYYRIDRPDTCRRDMMTGTVWKTRNPYPFSYANHGCNRYETIKKAKV
jgi:hypothetical protein